VGFLVEAHGTLCDNDFSITKGTRRVFMEEFFMAGFLATWRYAALQYTTMQYTA
jgi:hypothetical protein